MAHSTIFKRILLILVNVILFNLVQCRKGHLEPIGNSGTIEPLHERVGFIHPDEFLKDYVLKNRPVLMRKAFFDSPAIKIWNDEYLRESAKLQDREVTVEFGKKETRKNGASMKFSKFLQTYNESDVYMVAACPKNLEKDLIIPWPLQCEDYRRSFEDNVMWFSSGGTKSVIHHDGYENINCLIRGTKRFLFVNTTKYREHEQSIIDIQEGSYGSVDVDRVDLDKYPVYDGMEFFKAEMNPGDCVYSPHLWIHQVQSWDSNIAVNMWWFKEINSMIDLSKCSEVFNHSKTFNTASFHKTADLEDLGHASNVSHAVRHGYARLLFKAVNRDYVTVKEFVMHLLGSKDAINNVPNAVKRALVDLFRSLDANKNRKFDIKDLDDENLDDEMDEMLHQSSVHWTSMAKIYDCVLPVDLAIASERNVVPFHADELKQDDTDNQSEDNPAQTAGKASHEEL